MHRKSKSALKNNSETLFSEPDAAERLNVPYTTLRFWRQMGLVKHFQITNGRVCYAAHHLMEISEKSKKAAVAA
jgi:predicted site-specific integrase-resolvase